MVLQDGWCPLFARKFAPNARSKLRELERFYVSRLAAVEALASNGTLAGSQRHLLGDFEGAEAWRLDGQLAAAELELRELWLTGSLAE